MANVVFPFGIRERASSEGRIGEFVDTFGEDGKAFRRSILPARRYQMVGEVVLRDDDDDKGHAAWETHQDTYDGDTVLFKATKRRLCEVVDEAIGTAAGGGGETFTLAKKFIHHTDYSETQSTLVVRVAGVVQTLTTDYTFTLNGTTPTITTTGTFDTGAVTASYEYYHEVYVIPQRSAVTIRGRALAAPGLDYVPVRIIERVPGGHLA